ncbi:MAG: hypothetical protein ACLFRL_01255 [Desulfohalobiaceae bacterium]
MSTMKEEELQDLLASSAAYLAYLYEVVRQNADLQDEQDQAAFEEILSKTKYLVDNISSLEIKAADSEGQFWITSREDTQGLEALLQKMKSQA